MEIKLTTILFALIFLVVKASWGQDYYLLKNKETGRVKKLKSTTNLGFKTISDAKLIGNFGRIIQVTDSTVTIEGYVKRSLRRAIKPDTLTMKFSDIVSVKNYLIDDDDFNALGGMVLIGGALAFIATPIIWAVEGKDAGQEAGLISLGLFATGGLLLLPEKIGWKRKMTKWEFVKG